MYRGIVSPFDTCSSSSANWKAGCLNECKLYKKYLIAVDKERLKSGK